MIDYQIIKIINFYFIILDVTHSLIGLKMLQLVALSVETLGLTKATSALPQNNTDQDTCGLPTLSLKIT